MKISMMYTIFTIVLRSASRLLTRNLSISGRIVHFTCSGSQAHYLAFKLTEVAFSDTALLM
ncbi:hypothetical protein A1351_06600 [Methylosinus sp. R-45379]|nr:hypothetical protein A1351_06600 [Methylosinus sp. R-45379]